jgi:hypothetical protein
MFVLQRLWVSLPSPYAYLPGTAANETAPRKLFRLLDLPPELRNTIYDFVSPHTNYSSLLYTRKTSAMLRLHS